MHFPIQEYWGPTMRIIAKRIKSCIVSNALDVDRRYHLCILLYLFHFEMHLCSAHSELTWLVANATIFRCQANIWRNQQMYPTVLDSTKLCNERKQFSIIKMHGHEMPIESLQWILWKCTRAFALPISVRVVASSEFIRKYTAPTASLAICIIVYPCYEFVSSSSLAANGWIASDLRETTRFHFQFNLNENCHSI